MPLSLPRQQTLFLAYIGLHCVIIFSSVEPLFEYHRLL